ncbi:MAG: RIP metalloprotease RseP [Planctomycetes bacterium]|nr:RIP metalloprotease RseP [Planctomycetota bacterium]
MDWLIGVLGLFFGFSALVFVHELGHYTLAKWNGVRVKVFSIGMGPYLISFTKSETVYAFSLIPMGGYVKMLGQEDLNVDLEPANIGKKNSKDYRNKSPGQRAAILAAGAGFNLIFALLAFTICYYYGVEVDAPRVGYVSSDSPLAQAEMLNAKNERVPHPLQEGDLIRSLDGVPVRSFIDVSLYVAGAGRDHEIQVDYERDGVPVHDPVFVRSRFNAQIGAPYIGMERYGKKETHKLGFAIEKPVRVFVDEAKPGSPAMRAGLLPGDEILSIDGQPVQDLSTLPKAIKEADGKEQTLGVKREDKNLNIAIKAERIEEGGKTVYRIGLQMCTSPVEEIDETCEAYEQGLRKGYFLTHVEKMRDKDHLYVEYENLQASPPAKGKLILPFNSRTKSGLLYSFAPPEQVEIKCDTFVEALALAWSDLVRHSTAVFTVIKGLIMRDIDPKALSSPLGIGVSIFQTSVQRPFMYYFWFLAFLSVNLGVLQFVPIPLLDGWHLLVIGIEKLKGSPLPQRFLEYSQYAGILIILALLVLALSNDIRRMF